jgi:hypothetical protein
MFASNRPPSIGGPAEGQRRQSIRHLLRTRAVLRLAGRPPASIRVLDASTGGLGIEHDEPLGPPGSQGQIDMALPDGAASIRMTLRVELKYSIFKGSAMTSGLAFVALTLEQSAALERVLRGRPLLGDSAASQLTADPAAWKR